MFAGRELKIMTFMLNKRITVLFHSVIKHITSLNTTLNLIQEIKLPLLTQEYTSKAVKGIQVIKISKLQDLYRWALVCSLENGKALRFKEQKETINEKTIPQSSSNLTRSRPRCGSALLDVTPKSLGNCSIV